MRDLATAPVGQNVLVRQPVYRAERGFFVPALVGYKVVEARQHEPGVWRLWCGDLGTLTTETCSPVGWWPLPGNEDASVDLSIIPDDWWLYGLFHNHTPIRYRGEVHKPFDEEGFAWTCQLQHRTGGKATKGEGDTARAALADAVREVELRWYEEGVER